MRVENTDALQTTLVEMNQQGCSLMCIVRTYIMFSLGLVMFIIVEYFLGAPYRYNLLHR